MYNLKKMKTVRIHREYTVTVYLYKLIQCVYLYQLIQCN